MIKEFENLTPFEQELLFKTPAMLSVLASCKNNHINNAQKADAIKLSHLKTFTANPYLLDYYAIVEKEFKQQFEMIVKKYLPFDDAKREALKKEIELSNSILKKLDEDFAIILHKSLTGYSQHVRKAEHSVVENFIFPFSIHGLTD